MQGGCCSLNLYGGKPSLGVCERCPSYQGPARGLGDRIAKITKAIGIKPCAPCQARRVALNQLFPRGK